jgi:putative transposase
MPLQNNFNMQGGKFLKYKNRKQNRWTEYNYSEDGVYFVTICTKDRVEFFGKIVNGEMVLNNCGRIIEQQWLWLEKQYDYINLDEYSIMPNHFHGIIIIDSDKCRDRSRPVPAMKQCIDISGGSRPAPTGGKIKSLSELIGAFKTTSSKLIHQNIDENFAWQRSFYDHIIRNSHSLNQIRKYIYYNPIQWEEDRNNIENLQFLPK